MSGIKKKEAQEPKEVALKFPGILASFLGSERMGVHVYGAGRPGLCIKEPNFWRLPVSWHFTLSPPHQPAPITTYPCPVFPPPLPLWEGAQKITFSPLMKFLSGWHILDNALKDKIQWHNRSHQPKKCFSFAREVP